jgi:hypothetical protein
MEREYLDFLKMEGCRAKRRERLKCTPRQFR